MGQRICFAIDPWEIRSKKKKGGGGGEWKRKGKKTKKEEKRKRERERKKGKVVLFETWRRQVYRSCLQSLLIAGKPRGQERKSRTIRLNQ